MDSHLFLGIIIGTTQEEMAREFRDNESHRSKRKGAIKMYHDVLSWRFRDSDKITPDVAEQIAKRYVELRNEQALYAAVLHQDKKSHIHMHFAISSCEAYTAKPIRMSKAGYAELKKSMQAYEQELGILESGVEHGKNERMKKDREYQMEERLGKVSRKEEIKGILEKSLAEAISKESFYERVQLNGLSLYERGGKIAGVDDSRHMRFSTLGFDETRFQELQSREERAGDLEIMREDKHVERQLNKRIIAKQKR